MKEITKKIVVFGVMFVLLCSLCTVVVSGIIRKNEITREKQDIAKLASITQATEEALQNENVQTEVQAWMGDKAFFDVYIGQNAEFANGYIRDVYPALYKELQATLDEVSGLVSSSVWGCQMYIRISADKEIQTMVTKNSNIIKTRYLNLDMLQ